MTVKHVKGEYDNIFYSMNLQAIQQYAISGWLHKAYEYAQEAHDLLYKLRCQEEAIHKAIIEYIEPEHPAAAGFSDEKETDGRLDIAEAFRSLRSAQAKHQRQLNAWRRFVQAEADE